MDLTSGDMQICDPLAIIRVIYFVEILLNVQEASISYQKWPFCWIVSFITYESV